MVILERRKEIYAVDTDPLATHYVIFRVDKPRELDLRDPITKGVEMYGS